MDVIVILFCLCLLMYLSYKGFPVILLAPACGLLVIALVGKAVLPAYTELFMIKTVGFIKNFFPIFLLGSIFGQFMGDSGLANSIAKAIISKIGKNKALLAVVLAGNVLSYGGVSAFVVIFAIYPFASALYKEANIPKRFIIGAILLGSFCATLGCLPGTPQIQNVIPATYFGTNIFAGPGNGIVTGLVLWLVLYLYMDSLHKKATRAGEGYGENHINEPVRKEDNDLQINWLIALVPLLIVLGINFWITYYATWSPELLEPYKAMKLPMVSSGVQKVQSSWALICALTAGSVLIVIMGWRNFVGGWKGIIKSLNQSTNGALLAIMNTACLVGFGSIISSSDGFKAILDFLMGIRIGETPLWSMAISINLLAAITGSASGGVSIALDLMGKEWLAWGLQSGVPAEILTRIAAIASGGLSMVPHNGALITMLTVCGLTHKQSYGHVAVICLIKGSASFFGILLYYLFGNF